MSHLEVNCETGSVLRYQEAGGLGELAQAATAPPPPAPAPLPTLDELVAASVDKALAKKGIK